METIVLNVHSVLFMIHLVKSVYMFVDKKLNIVTLYKNVNVFKDMEFIKIHVITVQVDILSKIITVFHVQLIQFIIQ
jgi:hypothetical protein